MRKTLRNRAKHCLHLLFLSLLMTGGGACQAAPPAKDVPPFKVRMRVTTVDGQPPAAEQKFAISMNAAAAPVTAEGGEWSPWLVSDPAAIAKVLTGWPHNINRYWQVRVGCTVRPVAVKGVPAPKTFPLLAMQVESAIDAEGGETTTTDAQLFGSGLGLMLWKSEDKIHLDTMAGHGRRVYDKAMQDAFLPKEARPKKIIFGDRYIGGDNDMICWSEGINRLAGLGFNAFHAVPPQTLETLRATGINKVWGAIYSPPGYAFSFKPDRQAEFTAFVKKQLQPLLDAGWKKEDVAFWVTSDEPGWYYPKVYNDFNANPDALQAFHQYLQAQGLTPQDLGKAAWNEVNLIGRRQYADLPSRRLFYWSNRFVPWASSRFFGEVTKAYEAEIYPGVPVMVNFNNFMGRLYQPGPVGNNPNKADANAAMGQHDWLEFGRERGATAVSTEDWFGDGQASQWSFYMARMRAAAEMGNVSTGALVIPRVSGQRPLGMAQKLLALVGNGAKTIQFFVFGPEYNFPSNCYSENPKVFKPLATGMGMVAKAEDLLYPGQPRRPQVALLMPQSSQLWDLEEQENAKGLIDVTNTNMFRGHMAYESEAYSLFMALQHSAVPVQIVDEKKLTEPDFKNYKVLYLTAPDLPVESMQSVLRWVNDGGTLVTVAGTGLFDRYHQPLETLAKTSGVSVAAPVRIPFGAAAENGTLTFKGKALAVVGEREKMTLDGASVLSAFDDGTPALVEKKVGQGRILRFACYPGLAYTKSATGNTNGLAGGYSADWRELITESATAAGVLRPVLIDKPMIEAPALYSNAGVAVTLLNWSGETQEIEVTVRADKPVKRVESVEKGQLQFKTENGAVKLRLPVGDVDVLQLRY